jgi:CHAT domain-containing protein
LVEVTQRGLDLIVTVEFPNGDRRSFNSPLARDESEFVLLEQLEPGPHKIIIHSEEHTGAVGAHTTRIRPIHEKVNSSERAIWTLLTAGAEWNQTGGAERWKQAREMYATAAELARSSSDRRLRAYALYAAAMLDYWHLDNQAAAAELSAEAARLYDDLGERALAADAIHLQAASLIDRANESSDPRAVFTHALELFDRARATQEQLGRRYDLAHTLNNIGLTHYYMGDWDKARSYWERALPIFAELKEWSSQLLPTANLGTVDFEQGHLTNAVAAFDRALAFQAPSKDLRKRAVILANVASIERILGNYDAALRDFSCSRVISEHIDYAIGVGWALAGIGETYYAIGDFELADRYLRDALPIEQDAGDARGAAVVLRHLGNIEYSQADYESSLGFHRQALDSISAPPDRALAKFDIARDLSALGRHEEAVSVARDAFSAAEQTGSRFLTADANQTLGRTYLAAGQTSAALEAFESSLGAYAALGMEVEQARTLNGLALAARELGRLGDAAEYGQTSLQLIEKIRGRVADPELRAVYLSARRDYLELQIDLLTQLHETHRGDGYLMSALSTSERARARLTLDLVQDRGVAIDPRTAEQRADLYRQLAERRYQRDTLARTSPDVERSAAYKEVLSALASIENDLNLMETTERASDGVTAVQPLNAKEIQASLGADTALLQYALGSTKSYVWVVTQDSFDLVELAGRATIEAAARQVFDDLKTVRTNQKSNSDAAARRMRLAELVVYPIQQLLNKKRLLLVAADGALQYVPFTTLPLLAADNSSQLLIESHEIVDVPSVSAVVRERQTRTGLKPPKEIAVFADPVFAADDARLTTAQPAESRQTLSIGLPSTVNRRSDVRFSRLPLTAAEAGAIAALVPEDQRLIALGFDASRERLLAATLSDYRVIHLATHGVIDTRYPDLSALVFSQFDAAGSPKNGFVELHDIFGLNLNADLVVLSACDTALGREVSSEGLLGLTQGFMHAGAKSLVVALWSVSDRATAELMKSFYEHMLNEQMRPAEALRMAQRSIAAQSRWRDPYYWAAFTVVGDWS